MLEQAIKARYHNGENKLGILVDLGETNTKELTTADATPAILASVPIPAGKAVRVTGFVVARSGNNVASYSFSGLFKNVGGTTTQVGADVQSEALEDSALSTATLQVNPNDTTDSVDVVATGVAATQIVWVGQVSATLF